jgi:type I restriction enzyme S subunit
MKLIPYPEYKDSGVSWLGNVPAYWKVEPVFYAFSPQKIKNTNLIEKTVLSLSYGNIVVKPPEKLHGLVPESFETYQVINPGNIIIRVTDLQNDKTSLRVGIARNRGIITSAYLCLVTNASLIPGYGYLLLHAYDLKKIFYGMGSGLRQNLDFKDIKRMPILIPPPEEQNHIIKYIVTTTNKISRFIRGKRRLIKLLKEQKQAIINRAVARGLDPNVRLKPSGVDWLGDIPEHWELRRLRYMGTKFGSGVTPRGGAAVYQYSGIPLLRSQNIHFDGLRLDDVAFISEKIHKSMAASHVIPGDVLLNITGASIGRVCAVPSSLSEGNVNQHVCIIRPRADLIVSEFLAAFLSTPFIQREIYTTQNGASREGLPLKAIKALPVVLPPRNEQSNILTAVEEETQNIKVTILKAEREIELIREYRNRLIADVVTGKIDVRDVPVPEIPDIEETEELDASNEPADADETGEVPDEDD